MVGDAPAVLSEVSTEGHGTAYVGFWYDGAPVLVIAHDFHGNSAVMEVTAEQVRAIAAMLPAFAAEIERRESQDTP